MSVVSYHYTPGKYDYLYIVKKDDNGNYWVWCIDDTRVNSPYCVGRTRPRIRESRDDSWVWSKDWDMAKGILDVFADGWIANRLDSHDLLKESPYCTYAIIDDVVISLWRKVWDDGWSERIGYLSDDRCFVHYFTKDSGDEPHNIPEASKVSKSEASAKAIEILRRSCDERIQVIDDWVHDRDVDQYSLYPFKRIIDEARRKNTTVDRKRDDE